MLRMKIIKTKDDVITTQHLDMFYHALSQGEQLKHIHHNFVHLLDMGKIKEHVQLLNEYPKALISAAMTAGTAKALSGTTQQNNKTE